MNQKKLVPLEFCDFLWLQKWMQIIHRFSADLGQVMICDVITTTIQPNPYYELSWVQLS